MGKGKNSKMGRNHSGVVWGHDAASKCPPGADKVKTGNGSKAHGPAPIRSFPGKKG